MGNLIAVPARVGEWLDTDMPVSLPMAQRIVLLGYKGVFRYVPLPNNSEAHDISDEEIENFMAVDLQFAVVQHPRFPGCRPAAHSGAADAMAALRHLASLRNRYPRKAVIYQDLEGIDGTEDETARFANDFCSATVSAGQQAGEYAGYDDPLNDVGLYRLHAASTYWVDAGPRTVATRGHAVKQGQSLVILGQKFDTNRVAPDRLGDLPWVAAKGDPDEATA